jgi:fatty-acyl-CoA synthase
VLIPDANTLTQLLRERAGGGAARVAYAERDETVTWGELERDAEARALALRSAGVTHGDRVALLLPSGLEFIRTFWGVQLLGAISVSFNPAVPDETAIRRVGLVRPRLLVVPPNAPPSLLRTAMDAGIACFPAGQTASEGPLPRASVSPNDLAFLQPTSGTSGEPRAVMIRHRNALESVRIAADAMGTGADDVLVGWVPPWHDLGLVRFVIGTAYSGARCHLVAPAIATIPEWLSTISATRATITGAPDFAYRLAARLVDPASVDLRSLRYATNGGEPVRRRTIEAFEQRFGLRDVVVPAYGLAEATLGVTGVRPGEGLRSDERGNLSSGRPFPGIELRLDEADGRREILIRGDVVFAGYFDEEDATRAVLRDGWLHTGDTGHIDSDGHLYVLGRSKAMLKRGGAVLAPRELEEAVQHVPGVKLAAAVGVPSDGTEEIVLVVESDVPADETSALATNVAQAIRRAVGFVPERVLIVRPRAIPRTANGKIRHGALRDALIEGSLNSQLVD